MVENERMDAVRAFDLNAFRPVEILWLARWLCPTIAAREVIPGEDMRSDSCDGRQPLVKLLLRPQDAMDDAVGIYPIVR